MVLRQRFRAAVILSCRKETRVFHEQQADSNNISEEGFYKTQTWDLQVVAECIGFKGTEPGRVLLQVPGLRLKPTHGPCKIIHLPHKVLVLPLFKQLLAFRSKEFLHVFSKFLFEEMSISIFAVGHIVILLNDL